MMQIYVSQLHEVAKYPRRNSYYPVQADEYDTPANCNVLIGKTNISNILTKKPN